MKVSLFRIFSLLLCLSSCKSYDIIWNIQTQLCRKNYGVTVNASLYGMRENNVDGWAGSVITFASFGLLPYITSSGNYVNGGVPQVCM